MRILLVGPSNALDDLSPILRSLGVEVVPTISSPEELSRADMLFLSVDHYMELCSRGLLCSKPNTQTIAIVVEDGQELPSSLEPQEIAPVEVVRLSIPFGNLALAVASIIKRHRHARVESKVFPDHPLQSAGKEESWGGGQALHENTVFALERYRLLFEESKDMIYACSPHGVLTDINPAGVELLGYHSKREVIGRNIVDFYVGRRDRSHYDEQISQHGYVKDMELVMRRADGVEIFVLETSSALLDSQQRTLEVRGIVKDITDRIRAEQTQMQMSIKLAEANRQLKLTQSRLVQQEKLASIGQLAAGVAHEVNNPLGFVKSNFGSLERYIDDIRAYVQRLEQKLRDHRDGGDELVAQLRSNAGIDFMLEDIESIFTESNQGFERIVGIVRGLRTFSRVDSSGRIAEYDLNSAIEDALVMARHELKDVCEVRRELGDIPRVECRADEINQVLLNVIVNAAQAIKDGDFTEKRMIRIRTFTSGRSVVCEVEDEGSGIPAEILSRVFDPFFTTKEIGKGTGLGLSISYDIVVNRHGGELSVRSSPETGTTITVRLPISQEPSSR